MRLLKTDSGEKLQVLRQLQVSVRYNDQEQQLPLLVVAGDGPSLWGRDWVSAISRYRTRQVLHQRVGLLLQKYSEVFQEELGTLKGIEVKLVVQENAVSKFYKPRSVLMPFVVVLRKTWKDLGILV